MEDFAQKCRGLPRSRHGQIQICPAHLFGEQDDLSRVLLHVADNLIDRFQNGDIPSLGGRSFGQSLWRDRLDDSAGFGDGFLEQPHQVLRTHVAVCAELSIPDPNVGNSSDAVHDPLPHIATQMQDQISDCVFVVAMPLPCLYIGKTAHACSEEGRHLLELAARCG